MKTTFFTAALLGLTAVNAVTLESNFADFDDYPYYDFAQLEGEGNTLADADCEETVGGVTIRLSTPECQKEDPKPEVSFEQQMLAALSELSGKSMDLYEALKLQFAKNQKLAAGKRMDVSGSFIIKPKIDGTTPAPTPSVTVTPKAGDTTKTAPPPVTPPTPGTNDKAKTM